MEGLLLLAGALLGWLYRQNRQLVRQNARQAEEVVSTAEVLNARNERYRELLRQSADGILVLDAESWRIQETNAQFSHILGFPEAEVVWLHINDLGISNELMADLEQALAQGESRGRRRLKRKDGKLVIAELTAVRVGYHNQTAIVVDIRDVTEQVRLQEALQRDVKMAGQVQRSLLPAALDTGQVSIRTLFEPHHMVSGDFFHYTVTSRGKRLAGYVIDVTGHGLGTALQTAALNVLMQEAYQMELPLVDKVRWVNQNVMRYFTEETFAAMLCFELDFASRTLKLVPAGITGFFTASGGKCGLVKTPGSLLGIDPDPDIAELVVPVQPGDTFYFVTDGILELVERNAPADDPDYRDFGATEAWFKAVVNQARRWDDASGLFVRVN